MTNPKSVKSKKANIVGTKKERDTYIDWARGFAFVLVVAQHAGLGGLNKAVLAFHMPLFFIITGITFCVINVREKQMGIFVKKRVRKLLVPYVIFEIINLLISYGINFLLGLVHRDGFYIRLMPALKSIVLCINNENYEGISLRLWFLPCMALASVLFVLILYGLRNMPGYRPVFMILIITLAASYLITKCVTYDMEMRLPFTIDISLLAMFYIAFGYLIKNFLYFLRGKQTWIKILIIVFLCICLAICIKNNPENFYMYENSYGNYWLAVCGGIFGSVAFLLLTDILHGLFTTNTCLNKFLNWVNKNSILMFPLHLELIFVLSRVLNYFITNVWISCFILVIIVFVIMYVELKIIDWIRNKLVSA